MIAGLQRHRFGRRSERLDDEALQQATEDLEQSLAEQEAKLDAAQSAAEKPAADTAPASDATPRQRARRSEPAKRNRGALPAHLPRIELLIDVEEKTCPCCGGTLHQM